MSKTKTKSTLVNAAAILTKRAAPNVQSCITNINTVGNQLAILQASVSFSSIFHAKK